MRDTLRLLGIIALVALIGFGLMACNDGSTTTNTTIEVPVERPIEMGYPVESDFTYDGFFQVKNTNPNAPAQRVTITPKAGKTDGEVTIFYHKPNGVIDETPPTDIGSYLVTFNVAQSQDGRSWGTAKGLVAGYFTLAEKDAEPIDFIEDDFYIQGTGRFAYDPKQPRAVIITPKSGIYTVISDIRYSDSENIPVEKGTYTVTFVAAPGTGEGGVAYKRTPITVDEKITIWDGEEVDPATFRNNFLISGQSQVFDPQGTRRELKVVPKIGMPAYEKEDLTFYYEGRTVGNDVTVYAKSLLSPWERGNYRVTMDVAAKGIYKAGKDVFVDNLTIGNGGSASSFDADFDSIAFNDDGSTLPWGGAYDYDETEKGIYVWPKTGKSQGIITYYYLPIGLDGKPNYDNVNSIADVFPVDAGEYQVAFTVGQSTTHAATNLPLSGTTAYLKLPTLLVINPIKPVESDFTVVIKEYLSYDPELYIRREVPIGNAVIGPYTYKNIRYPVEINYRGNNANSWINIYYNDATILDPSDESKDWGPVNAGTYDIKFNVKPQSNFLAISLADVGTMTINKNMPLLSHFEITGNTSGVYLATPWTYPGLRRKTETNPPVDNWITSDGLITVTWTAGQPVTTASPNTVVTGIEYKRSATVAETTNWLPATFTDFAGFTVTKATRDTAAGAFDPKFTEDWRHVQEAYKVEDVLQFISPKSVANVSSITYYYTKTATGIGTANPEPSGTRYDYVPQREGRYYVWGEMGTVTTPNPDVNIDYTTSGRKQYNLIENAYPGIPAAFKEWGLVVNPLIIYNMTIFEEWLSFVKPKLNAPGFSEVTNSDEGYQVVFVLGTDDDRGPFNSETYNFTTIPDLDGVFIDNYSFRELLEDCDNPATGAGRLPIYLNFGFGDELDSLGTLPGEYTVDDLNTNFDGLVIAAGAFANLTNITKVTFPFSDFILADAGVEDAASDLGVFEGCSGLKAVPERIVEIGNRAFIGSGVTELALEEEKLAVTRIGASAFEGVDGKGKFKSLTVVNDYTGLLSIESSAFRNTVIEEVSIPESVIEIGEAAFADCEELHIVEFKGDIGAIRDDIEFYPDTFPGDLYYMYRNIQTGGGGKYTRSQDPNENRNSWSNQDNPNIIVLP
jgi:hypothetical protein